ncbi:MAG: hypothetical protein CVV27_15740 [Candidatus Melainabacteria bacterium HGW-Melainabacteria-1]|nr:MAG: hypothetical protein CVV27_15740 [Candidatus Melainabacteria bacterium HGW-Melainabacteria-1]
MKISNFDIPKCKCPDPKPVFPPKPVKPPFCGNGPKPLPKPIKPIPFDHFDMPKCPGAPKPLIIDLFKDGGIKGDFPMPKCGSSRYA